MITVHTPSGKSIEIEHTGLGMGGNSNFAVRVPEAKFSATVWDRAIKANVIDCGKTKIQIADSDVDAVTEYVAQAKAADAATPEEQARRLRGERESLASRIAGLAEASDDESNAAWERGAEKQCFAIRAQYDAKLDAAHAALREFDAAHPEVLGTINQEREAAMQRLINS